MNLDAIPTTQIGAIRYFANEETCHDFLVGMRWGDSVRCVHCISANVGKLVISSVKSRSKKNPGATIIRRLWNCKACKKQFTAKTGTIFEDSPLGLDKWLPAVWMICNAKNGVSSCELARALGITQKSAWHMGHRIRAAMANGGFNKFKGDVEVDETYIGGKAQFMHKDVKARRLKGGKGSAGKAIVQGFLERGGRVRTIHVKDSSKATLDGNVRANVEAGSNIYTDAHSSYVDLRPEFQHEFVDHAVTYVKGRVHTNGLENFWSCLKRTLKGTYVRVEPVHLSRYLDEQITRFNERFGDDRERFMSTLRRVAGRHLSYAALTDTSTA